MHMIAASTLLLAFFALLAAVDGVYLHLWKFRLHARPRSWMEHVWHTISAVLFVPILITLFLAPTAGPVLWAGVALLGLLHIVEVFDVKAERDSRTELGGLPRAELALHWVLVGTRSISTALALVARPSAAWSMSAPLTIGAHPAWVTALVGVIVPGTIAIAVLHLVLAWRYRPIGCCAVAT
ncbi:MAG: hypothetical protein HOW73_15480 [Polyangiaceae bacterium]|nr:hypothetical protein [Polyangiaceae bacterium]